jgi:hypothetical protein
VRAALTCSRQASHSAADSASRLCPARRVSMVGTVPAIEIFTDQQPGRLKECLLPVPPRGDSTRADMDDAVRPKANDRLTMPAEHADGASGVGTRHDTLAVGAVSPIGAVLKTTDVPAHTRGCTTTSAPLPLRKPSASR